MKRRAFLGSLGGLVILLAGGGVWRAHRQGVFSIAEGPAFEPWHDWRTSANEGPLALVRAAILGANPHNTQPWLFDVSDTRIDLYADTARNLGAFDPYLREMHIGLGCALENMTLAATAYGYRPSVTLIDGALGEIPSGSVPQVVARVELGPDREQSTPLFEAIGSRHTNRGPYDLQRPIDADDLDAFHRLVEREEEVRLFLFTSEVARAKCAALVVSATEAIIEDAAMIRDSDRWFRHAYSDVHKFRDGPILDTAGLPPLVTAMAKVLPAPSADTNHQYWLEATRKVHVATAPLLGLIAVRDLYDRPQSLRAGRAWQRMHLWGANRGLAMQPLNQPVELVDRQRQLDQPPRTAMALAELVGDSAWKPTFAFRVGYALRDAPPSPRRPVEQTLR